MAAERESWLIFLSIICYRTAIRLVFPKREKDLCKGTNLPIVWTIERLPPTTLQLLFCTITAPSPCYDNKYGNRKGRTWSTNRIKFHTLAKWEELKQRDNSRSPSRRINGMEVIKAPHWMDSRKETDSQSVPLSPILPNLLWRSIFLCSSTHLISSHKSRCEGLFLPFEMGQ